mmetsp:Transcript_21796/g.32651  ORF Transcript_21796/g.32651 Transcript_21796/m.32651 type:complete len:724 (+) Transcript_21796:22-2193(+)
MIIACSAKRQRRLSTVLASSARIRVRRTSLPATRLYLSNKLIQEFRPRNKRLTCTHSSTLAHSLQSSQIRQHEVSSSDNVQHVMDFFGEPVSFFKDMKGRKSTGVQRAEESLMAFDTFLLQYVSRGKASSDGGDEFGVSAKASHSTAIPWSDLFRQIAHWSYKQGDEWKCQAPMLVCAALSPMLAVGGSSYLKLLDESYARRMVPSFVTMAKAATSYLDDENMKYLTTRERHHLLALSFLLRDEHSKALSSLRRLLELCPGDALGLSLTLDITSSLGDQKNAFQAATSVASYWNERGQRLATGQTAIPGHAIGSSLIALGLAIGGRHREAEQLVDVAIKRDYNVAAGICAWALAHIYDGEGRVSEGTSTLTGFGVEYYEDCGFLFFDTIIAGFGGRFVLDRDGASSDNVSLRLYDEFFGRVLKYSGYNNNTRVEPVFRKVPRSRKKMLVNSAVNSASGVASSVLSRFLGQSHEEVRSLSENEDATSVIHVDSNNAPGLEDIFTWLPPTPNLLTEATLLLTRLTISGAINTDDERWSHLRAAWGKIVEIEKRHCDRSGHDGLFDHFPLSRVAVALVLGDTHLKRASNDEVREIEDAFSLMGKLLQQSEQHDSCSKNKWGKVASSLSDIRCGRGKDENLFGWNQNFGNFLEHSICFCALNSEDYQALCAARSVCSEGITLRANSPEMWFRYGTILEKLGDNEGANNAFHASISLGAGEGGRVNTT